MGREFKFNRSLCGICIGVCIIFASVTVTASEPRLSSTYEPEAEGAEKPVVAWFDQNSDTIYDSIIEKLLADGTIDQTQYDHYYKTKI